MDSQMLLWVLAGASWFGTIIALNRVNHVQHELEHKKRHLKEMKLRLEDIKQQLKETKSGLEGIKQHLKEKK